MACVQGEDVRPHVRGAFAVPARTRVTTDGDPLTGVVNAMTPAARIA